jgi:hypothetical protein
VWRQQPVHVILPAIIPKKTIMKAFCLPFRPLLFCLFCLYLVISFVIIYYYLDHKRVRVRRQEEEEAKKGLKTRKEP